MRGVALERKLEELALRRAQRKKEMVEGKEKDKENNDMLSTAGLWARREAYAWKELLIKSLKKSRQFQAQRHAQK